MKNKTILIAGGTVLVGKRLQEIAADAGYTCYILTRSPKEKNHIHWDTNKGFIDSNAIPAIDYVVNLSGEGIADKKWDAERKKILLHSRTEPIRILSNWISGLAEHPKAFVTASGVGYYGEGGDIWQKEGDKAGKGFLAETAKIWEEAAYQIQNQGIRTVILRLGIVLSMEGGALPEMSMTFKAGFGTYFGNGKQYIPWIHIDDVCRMILFSLENEGIKGIYNATAPNPETNYAFTKKIAQALGKPPILLPAPKIAIQLAMGERYEMVFTSNRASSEKIVKTGFTFQFNTAEDALKDIFKK